MHIASRAFPSFSTIAFAAPDRGGGAPAIITGAGAASAVPVAGVMPPPINAAELVSAGEALMGNVKRFGDALGAVLSRNEAVERESAQIKEACEAVQREMAHVTQELASCKARVAARREVTRDAVQGADTLFESIGVYLSTLMGTPEHRFSGALASTRASLSIVMGFMDELPKASPETSGAPSYVVQPSVNGRPSQRNLPDQVVSDKAASFRFNWVLNEVCGIKKDFGHVTEAITFGHIRRLLNEIDVRIGVHDEGVHQQIADLLQSMTQEDGNIFHIAKAADRDNAKNPYASQTLRLLNIFRHPLLEIENMKKVFAAKK